jgi:hypothetical protein
MPCVVEWHGKSVYWNFNGVIDTEQVIDVFSTLYAHERFDETRGQVRDYSNVEGSFGVTDVRKIAAFDRAAAKTNPQMKIALVTMNEENQSAFAALYNTELYESPWEVNIFTCSHEALAWVA